MFGGELGSSLKRVLLKISGEALGSEGGLRFREEVLDSLATQLSKTQALGSQVALVIGGGNILRGGADGSALGLPRVSADFMGMLATVINAVALEGFFTSRGIPTKVMTPFSLQAYVELYSAQRADHYLEEGWLVILAGGTGNPYFSTDSAAALRAAELKTNLLIKATKVNGVYDSDPVVNPQARRYDQLSFKKVLEDDLKVMDLTAISLCAENAIPIRVVDLFEGENILALIRGESVGTLVS
jgi:uridylate kinase